MGLQVPAAPSLEESQPGAAERRWEGHAGPLCDARRGFDVIACRPCGFRHAVPLPTPEELRELYRHDYYVREKPLSLARQREDLPWWSLVFRERYELFETLLGAGRRRLLEVGAGGGFFLRHGQERGWEALGFEPSRQAAAHARSLGVAVREAFLDEAGLHDLEPADVVYLNEVLEHVPDPRAVLELAHRALAPGGLVCVVVPNDYNPLQEALRSACGYEPWWVAPPHHLNYFDFDTLARLLERAGFAVVHREATFPMELFLLMGDAYVGNDALGRHCHAKRKALELHLDAAGLGVLKRRLYQSLAELGLGRAALLVGRRP